MVSIGFPNMVTNTKTNTLSGLSATSSNLKLLLKSDRGALIGDPLYGTNLKKVFMEPNCPILKDKVTDHIYTAILMFMPQLRLGREDIQLFHDGTTLYATIKALNMLDYTTNLYNISLIDKTEI